MLFDEVVQKPKAKKEKKQSLLKPKTRAFDTYQPKVLYKPAYSSYFIVVPGSMSEKQLSAFKMKCIKHGEDEPTIISLFDPAPKTAGKNFVKDCYRVDLDLSSFIPPNSKVITMGDMTLQALTLSQDLSVAGFYDYVLNKTYFYHPKLASWVFPAGDWMEITFNNSWDLAFFNIQKEYLNKTTFPPKPRAGMMYRELKSMEEVEQVFHDSADLTTIAIDLETSGLDFMNDYIGCVTFSMDGKVGYYVDWKQMDAKRFGQLVRGKKQLYANGKFDIKFLIRAGVERAFLHIDGDVVQLSHVLNEMSSNSLKSAAWMYSFHGGYDLDLKKQLHVTGEISFLGADSDILKEYATKDAILTWIIHENMLKELRFQDSLIGFAGKKTMEDYYFQYMLPAVNLFIDLEYDGMLINVDALRKLSEETLIAMTQAKKEILQALQLPEDTMVNIDSGAQLGKLFEEKGYPCIERGKTGVYKTNKAVLQEWQKISDYEPVINALFKYKQLKTMYNTFVGEEEDQTGFWKYLKNHEDGTVRVHSNFGTMLANSGRNRSSSPNLQNGIKHGDLAKSFRSIFAAPKDFYIGEWDAAGLQLRIAGILSDDPAMREAFLDKKLKGDLHSMTAQSIFARNISLDEFLEKKGEQPYKEYRFYAKACNFSLLFGTSAFSFAVRSLKGSWSEEDCKTFMANNSTPTVNLEDRRKKLVDLMHQKGAIGADLPEAEKEKLSYYWVCAIVMKDRFFLKYGRLQQWMHEQISWATDYGYVTSVFGAVRRLPKLTREKYLDPGEKKEFQNISINSPVQTYEAVLIMDAMVHLHKELKKRGLRSKIVCTVHDSCVMYIHKEEVDEVNTLIKTCFEQDREENKGIPMIAELNVADYEQGEVWGFGKEYV